MTGFWADRFKPSFWCEILKIVLALVRSELSELSLILNRESLSDLSFSPIGFFWWDTRKITEKDVIILIDSPEETRLVVIPVLLDTLLSDLSHSVTSNGLINFN